jgi:hypothetical protein
MTMKFKALLVAGTILLPASLAAQSQPPAGNEMQPPTQGQTPPPAGEQTPPPSETPDTSSQPPTPDTGQATDQTTPGTQATTPGAQAQAGATTPATAADLRAGATVHDTQGGTVGTIESADASGAVINTGAARARLPLTSFARNDSGLVISMTKAQLEAAARPQANPSNPS